LNIQFADKKMLKNCSDAQLAAKKWGQRGAKIRQRLDEFRAAVSLRDIALLPPARLHPLKGDRLVSLPLTSFILSVLCSNLSAVPMSFATKAATWT
jgi:hypothetical protein